MAKLLSVLIGFFLTLTIHAQAALAAESSAVVDPLPSWNEGAAKQAIGEFVAKVIKPDSPYFVPVTERIAVFDNDGTLWGEQPMSFQFLFALDRVKALAPQHPEWKTKEPFAALLKGDVNGVLLGGKRAMLEIDMVTHAGMTTEEFEKIVTDWITTARHPKTGRLYTELVYQPMVQLLAYLRANGFKNFIVDGGVSNLCDLGWSVSTASRQSRSSAAASKRSSSCATASPCSCDCAS